MAVRFKLSLDQRFKRKLAGRFEKYEFQAGVLKDGPHFRARSNAQGTLQGGPVRKMNKAKTDRFSTGAISRRLLARYKGPSGGNVYTDPLRRKSRDMSAFLEAFANLVTGKNKNYSRVETMLRALIRNPLLKRRYGSNTQERIRVKGFNRLMIDTGQFFKAIQAKVRVRRVQK